VRHTLTLAAAQPGGFNKPPGCLLARYLALSQHSATYHRRCVALLALPLVALLGPVGLAGDGPPGPGAATAARGYGHHRKPGCKPVTIPEVRWRYANASARRCCPCFAGLRPWDPAGARLRRSAPFVVAKPPLFRLSPGPHSRGRCSRRCAPSQKGVRAFAVACGFPSVRCGRPVRLPLLPSGSPWLPLFCALRVLPPRCACACSARPLRRGAPAAASRARSGFFALGPFRPSPGPPLSASGRGSDARPLPARLRARRALAAPGPLPLALAALRVSLSVALASLGRGSAAAVGPPLPLGLARCGGAALPFAPPAASGAAGSGPGPLAALCAAFFRPLPRALLRAPLRSLASLVFGLPPLSWHSAVGGSPPAPPRPAAPLRVAPGSAWPCWGACGPPCCFAARLPRGLAAPFCRAPSHCSGGARV